MAIPKHLMEAKLCNKDTCEEIRRLKEEMKIKDGINETTFKNLMEERKENQRLNNILNELKEDIPHLLDIINRNEKEIKVYQDEWFAVSSLEYKLQELKESDK